MLPRRAIDSLIVVSNRLPYSLPDEGLDRSPKRNVGGLVNALEPVLASAGGCWVGWDGVALVSDEALLPSGVLPTHQAPSGVELCGVPLTEIEVERYYHGLANRTLWPLCHNLLDKSVFNEDDWTSYATVNRRFAEATLARTRPGGRVWVHDYHLMLVPLQLRAMGFTGRIDFFLHIPFPPPETFLTLPWRESLIDGMLASDTIGFHVAGYRDNFIRSAQRVRGDMTLRTREDGHVEMRHETGTTVAAASPIGIDVEDFERTASLPDVQTKAQRLRAARHDRAIVFGADRLDYTKGIKERLLAVERLLVRQPERRGRFVMLQVVVPSRSQVDEYKLMKREIDQHVGRINGAFGRDGWNPIEYQYRALGREDLVAHYRAADVALVTPLRDGMNLVAPEFVASRTDDDGVLVLSEFAGVAEQLTEALPVNPYDLEHTASTIATALDMHEDERAARMRGLRQRIQQNTTTDWAERCLELPVQVPAGVSPVRRFVS